MSNRIRILSHKKLSRNFNQWILFLAYGEKKYITKIIQIYYNFLDSSDFLFPRLESNVHSIITRIWFSRDYHYTAWKGLPFNCLGVYITQLNVFLFHYWWMGTYEEKRCLVKPKSHLSVFWRVTQPYPPLPVHVQK